MPRVFSHCPTPAEAADLAQTTACKDTFNSVLLNFVKGLTGKLAAPRPQAEQVRPV